MRIYGFFYTIIQTSSKQQRFVFRVIKELKSMLCMYSYNCVLDGCIAFIFDFLISTTCVKLVLCE